MAKNGTMGALSRRERHTYLRHNPEKFRQHYELPRYKDSRHVACPNNAKNSDHWANH